MNDYQLNLKLMEAIESNDCKNVQKALEDGAHIDCTFSRGRYAKTQAPLFLAAKKGNPDILKFLVQYGGGAITNLKIWGGTTALMMAAEYGREKGTRVLIEAGANVNAVNEWGKKAINYAAQSGKKRIFTLLLDAGTNVEPDKAYALLCDAAKGGNVKILEEMGKRGLLNGKKGPRDKRIPLVEAARSAKANSGTVRFLISRGGDPNKEDDFGNSPLTAAMENKKNSVETMRTLLGSGADVNRPNKCGPSVLFFYASYSDNSGANGLSLLINAGADLNIRDDKGLDMFMRACSVPGIVNEETARILLSSGAEINSRDSEGKTPLIHAAIRGNFHAAEVLVNMGADMKAGYGTSGSTAAMEAWKKGDVEIFKLLVGKGALRGTDPLNFTLEENKIRRAQHGLVGIMHAILAAEFLPRSCKEIDETIAWHRSASMQFYLTNDFFREIIPPADFLSMMTRDDSRPRGVAVKKESVEKIVQLLLCVMEENPSSVIDFLKKRIGKRIEKWVRDGVRGADVLVSMIAARMRTESLEDITESDGDFSDVYF